MIITNSLNCLQKLEGVIWLNTLVRYSARKKKSNCNYESAYYDITIATPEPIFNNEFIKNIRKPSSLDWRKSANIVLDKVSIDQPIELIADNYMDINFSDFSDVICICPSSGNNYISLVIEKFREMLSENKTANKIGVCAIIPGYELHYHASLLECINDDIESCKAEDRIILFYSKLNLVVIMRIATSLDLISLESKNCLNDVALFINVNSPYIEANKLVVLGIIVLPTFERKELNEELFFLFSETWREEKNQEQKFIQFLFLCKDDMEDNNFNQWWRLVVGYCCNKIKDKSNKLAFFKKLIGLTMIIMATDDKFIVPTIHNETQKQIKTLILNYEQWNAIYRKELKKIITGGYGSGKSVVGQEIVKKCLSETSENHLTLYYICCNHFSLFEYEMKKFVDKIEKSANVTVVCDNLHELWEKIPKKKFLKKTNISIPVLLEHLVVNNTNKVYFILEELSSDYVNEEDTIQLKKLFLSSLKESLVVFIPESVEKYRELIRNKEKQVIQKNYFNKEMLGMEVFDLKKSMRVTMCNKLLIDSSENSISESKTVCNFPNSKINKKSQMNKKDLFEKKHSQIKQTQHSSTESNDEPTIKSKLNDDHSVGEKLSDLEKTNDKKSVHNSHDSDQNYLSNTKVESTSDITGSGYYEYDIDQMSKQVSVQTNGVIPKCIMETSYLFKPGTIGHSIKGEKPMVIRFPFHDITDMHSVKILSVVLQHLFIEKLRKTVVICNNMEEVQSVAYAIEIIDAIEKFKAVTYAPYLQKNTPTFAEKVKVIQDVFNEFDILVTDSKGFSGAESESVVVVVRLDEIFLRHVLVDAMARSNSHLVILVLDCNDREILKQKGTIENVINDWSENIVEEIKVDVCNKDDQLCTRTGFCLTISKNCKEFDVRGSKEDFDAYKDNIKFIVNEKNIARFETMALEIQGGLENKNDYIKDQKMFIECFYEAQASNLLTDEIRFLIDNEQWTISIENEKASYEVLCESYFVNYLLGSGKRLERLDVLKSFLTPDEENLIMKCLSNVSIVHIYFPFKVSGWIPKNKIERLWINFKSYFVSKEDFTSFYPWISVCESLALYLHEDTNFLQEIYEHICTLNFKELIINYRNIDLHTHDEFKRFLDNTEE
nr:uncharacterized protein LOC105848254 isoform X2 [Hydra vulgaris]